MNKPLRQILAENVQTLMDRSQESVASLAQKVGVSRAQIYNILTQKTGTKTDTLEIMARVFDIQPALLLYVHPQGMPFSQVIDRLERGGSLNSVGSIELTAEAGDLMAKFVEPDGELASAFGVVWIGKEVEHAAFRAMIECFMAIDDEGRASMLRHAAAEAGVVPAIEGARLPRDWRELARAMDHADDKVVERKADSKPAESKVRRPRTGSTAVKIKASKIPRRRPAKKRA